MAQPRELGESRLAARHHQRHLQLQLPRALRVERTERVLLVERLRQRREGRAIRQLAVLDPGPLGHRRRAGLERSDQPRPLGGRVSRRQPAEQPHPLDRPPERLRERIRLQRRRVHGARHVTSRDQEQGERGARGVFCAVSVLRFRGSFGHIPSAKMTTKKNYVLDTNVLLHDPQAIFRFEENNVIIPIYCIEEVDQFKREGSERGRNARQIARNLDDLRESGRIALARRAAEVGRHPARRGPRDQADSRERARQDGDGRGHLADRLRRARAGQRPADGVRHAWTPTSASAPTRSGWSRRTTRTSGSRSDSLHTGIHEIDVKDGQVDVFFHEGAPAGRQREPVRQPLDPPARQGQPDAHRARSLRRGSQGGRRAEDAARRRHGRAPAQQGAELRHRPPARRVDPPGHAGRQGGHRQDAPRARGWLEAHAGGRRVHAHARLASGHAARSRHRIFSRATSTRS